MRKVAHVGRQARIRPDTEPVSASGHRNSYLTPPTVTSRLVNRKNERSTPCKARTQPPVRQSGCQTHPDRGRLARSWMSRLDEERRCGSTKCPEGICVWDARGPALRSIGIEKWTIYPMQSEKRSGLPTAETFFAQAAEHETPAAFRDLQWHLLRRQRTEIVMRSEVTGRGRLLDEAVPDGETRMFQ